MIQIVTWYKDRPYEVVVKRDGTNTYDSYDVDFTLQGQGYYHCSGCGTLEGGPYDLGPLPEEIETLDDLVEYYDLVEGPVVYCKMCDGCMPEDYPCQHLIWDDEAGCWGGSGSCE